MHDWPPNPRLQRTRVRPTGGRSPLSRKPFGATRLSTPRVVAAIVSAGLTLAAAAEITVSFGPSPAGTALRMIADGLADEQSLAAVIVEAAEKKWEFPLMSRLLDVLEAYSRDGQAQMNLVGGAFGDAHERASSDASRKAIAVAADTLRIRLKSKREQRPVRGGWFRHDPAISLDVPLTERSQGDWPMPVFHDRVAGLLERHLPREDRRLYVREAFRAFLATSCGALFGGSEMTTCERLGLWPLRYQAVSLGLAGLSSDGSDPSIAEVYLSQDRDLLEAVISQAELIHPGGFSRQCWILRRWLHRAPSRWEIWADLEPTL